MAYTVTFADHPQTLVKLYGPFAVVRHDFTLARDRFYTVRDTRTGQDFTHTFRQLRNAKRQAQQTWERHYERAEEARLAGRCDVVDYVGGGHTHTSDARCVPNKEANS